MGISVNGNHGMGILLAFNPVNIAEKSELAQGKRGNM
jgi:hypothetical protein